MITSLLYVCEYWLNEGRFLVANTAEHAEAVELLESAIRIANSEGFTIARRKEELSDR